MRTLYPLALAVLAAACAREPTAPTPSPAEAPSAVAASQGALFGAGPLGAIMRARRGNAIRRLLRALPANLKVTPDQQQTIKGLVQSFARANKSDMQSLAAIARQAREAKQAGKSKEEIKAILATGAPIRKRLAAARAGLKTQVEGVLTADQRAWLAAHAPKPCDRSKVPPLTDAQKAQVKSLVGAFRTNNKADIDAAKAVMQEARAARQAGKSKEEIKAILTSAKPTLERLAAARKQLRSSVAAVLTPEQRACGR